MLDELKQVRAGVLTGWACLLWVARHANGQLAQVAPPPPSPPLVPF